MFHVQFPALGLDLTINRIAFTLFGVDVYWYGIILATSMVLGVLVAFNLAKRRGVDPDKLMDVILVGGVFSIICARAYYVAFAPFKYDSFWDMINLRDGGIAIYGAVIGAFVFGALACKWRKIDALEVCDIAATCFLLGQGIGRWGNFINQEAFGTNTNSLFGMISEGTTAYLLGVKDRLALQGVMVDPYQPVHPTFLYESIWCLVGFALLMWYFNRKKFKGEMLCLYLAWYGLGRYFIEGIRTDSLETTGGFRTSQLVAVATVVIALGVIAFMRYQQKKIKNNTPADNSSTAQDVSTQVVLEANEATEITENSLSELEETPDELCETEGSVQKEEDQNGSENH